MAHEAAGENSAMATPHHTTCETHRCRCSDGTGQCRSRMVHRSHQAGHVLFRRQPPVTATMDRDFHHHLPDGDLQLSKLRTERTGSAPVKRDGHEGALDVDVLPRQELARGHDVGLAGRQLAHNLQNAGCVLVDGSPEGLGFVPILQGGRGAYQTARISHNPTGGGKRPPTRTAALSDRTGCSEYSMVRFMCRMFTDSDGVVPSVSAMIVTLRRVSVIRPNLWAMVMMCTWPDGVFSSGSHRALGRSLRSASVISTSTPPSDSSEPTLWQSSCSDG